MSKKKGKGQTENVNWDEGLLNEKLSDEKWQPFIAFVAPSLCSADNIIHSLINAVEGGSRRRFTVIDKESMLGSAREDAKLASAGGGGGGKKSKMGTAPADKPLHPEVCEHIVNALSTGEPVPAPLTARMLKYKILRRRTADIAAKEALLKEAEEALKPSKGASAKGKGGGGGRASKKGKDTPAGKGGGEAGGDDFPMPQKPPTTMKKRGEEDLDSKYIDDEPKDGPSAFILLRGFHEAEVYSNLEKIGVSANALVKISSKRSKDQVPAESTELTEEEQTDLANRASTLSHFWYNINHTITSSPDGAMLRDMAVLDLLFDDPPPELEDNVEERIEYSQGVFSTVAQELYGLLDSYKQYQSYIKYLDLRGIPFGLPATPSQSSTSVEPEAAKSPELQEVQQKSHSVDMRLYNQLMDEIPEESVTASVVLDCMLEQVEATLSQTPEEPRPDSLHKMLNNTFINMLSTLPSSKPTSNKQQDPVGSNGKTDYCINWNDELQLVSLGTPGLAAPNKKASELSILFSSLTFPAPAPSLAIQYEKQFHSLKHFCAKSSQGLQVSSILTGLLAALSLEHAKTLPPSYMPNNGFVLEEDDLLFDWPLAIPLKQQSSSSAALVPVNDGSDFTPVTPQAPPLTLDLPDPLLDLSNYTVLEPLSHDIILQVIKKLQSTHPYISLHHHKLTGSLIVAMYSGSTAGDPSSEYSWNTHIHSKISFSNYLKYVQKMVGVEVDNAVEEDKEQRNEIEEERKAILEAKAKEMEEKQAAAAKKEAESKGSSAKGGKKGRESSSKKSSAGKKSTVTSRVQTPAPIEEDLVPTSCLPEFKERTLYRGYDIGDRVLLSKGSVNRTFTSDGVCITSEKSQFAEGPITRKVCLADKHVSLSAVSIQSVGLTPPPSPPSTSTDTHEESDKDKPDSPSPPIPEILNPIPQPQESVLFSAFESTIGGSVTVAVSNYGLMGDGSLPFQPKSAERLEQFELRNRPESSKESRPPSQQGGGKLSKKQQEEQQRLLEQQQAMEEKLARERKEIVAKLNEEKKIIATRNKYQQLTLSTEHGLHITCSTMADSLDESGGRAVYIQQAVLPKDLPPPPPQETSRVCLSDGNVIKYMADKSVVVLCSDGSVFKSVSSSCSSSYQSLFASGLTDNDDEVFLGPDQSTSQTKVSFMETLNDKNVLPKGYPSPRDVLWEVTHSNGDRSILKYIQKDMETSDDKDEIEGTSPSEKAEEEDKIENKQQKPVWRPVSAALDSIPVYTATDPKTKEVLVTREDKVLTLTRQDGTVIAEHSDGTRITSQPAGIVSIEHPVFARAMFSSRDRCLLDVPSNVQITCNPCGEYLIRKVGGVVLRIASSGAVTYENHAYKNSSYAICHTNEHRVLTAKDGAGHTYSVSFSEGISMEGKDRHIHSSLLPHIFIMSSDGSGYQLCSKQEMEEFVSNSIEDTIIRDKLVQCPSINTVTVISSDTSVHSNRLLPYLEENIIPKNLQSSHCQSSTTEKRRFGVGVGKGLSIGSYVPPAKPKVFTKPRGLKYRQFIDFSGCGLREALLSCLLEYVQWREEVREREDSLLPEPKEEQLKEGRDTLRDILSLRSLSSGEEFLALYQEAWEKENLPQEHKPTEKNRTAYVEKAEDTCSNVKDPSLNNEEWVESANKEVHEAPPDIDRLSSSLPANQPKKKISVSFHLPESRTHPQQADLEVTGLHSDRSTPTTSVTLGLSDMESSMDGEPLPGLETLAQVPPSLIFTPTAGLEVPSPMLRPSNPTPQQAVSSGVNQIPITSTPVQRTNEIPDNDKGPSPSAPVPPFSQSSLYGASGTARLHPVKLPHSVSGGKPGEKSNSKFSEVEEPVRRKVKTSSTSQRASMRGFEVLPSLLHFGNLKEGCTYSHKCTLRNIGIDTCRFKIKAPPPSTGIRIIYSPGPVVAGMSKEFSVEIFALAVGASSSNEVGGVNHELEIISEANLLYLPIQACIFPPSLYEQCFGTIDSLAGAVKGTTLVTERPSSREDLNRPARKH